MPQLDVVTYLTQYLYTLIILFILFLLLINLIIPKIQKQLIIRIKLDGAEIKKETVKVEIFKNLFKL